MLNPAGWAASDSQDNGLATVTVAAVAGKQHIIYSVAAGYTAAVAGKQLTVKVGTTTVLQTAIYTSGSIPFPRGISAPINTAVTAELEASGAAGTIGAVTLHGVTI
jgi:hypothetical protein